MGGLHGPPGARAGAAPGMPTLLSAVQLENENPVKNMNVTGMTEI
jgi:hypothetical protein